jgi:hypothetical protein
VKEPESGAHRRGRGPPVFARDLKHIVGADHVGRDERSRIVDRAVDVGLGGKMDNRVRPFRREQGTQTRRVADIRADEAVARVAGGFRHVGKIAGIGEAVRVHGRHAGPGDEAADDRGADEAGATRDEDLQSVLRRPGIPSHA